MSAPPRQTASSIVAQWLKTRIFPEHLLAGVHEQRGVICEIVYGVIRRYRTLSWIVDRYARKRPAPPVEAALLVGLYQMLYMDSVPDHAAINQTVEGVKSAGHTHAAPFVNGLLRNVQRERDALDKLLAQQPPGVRLSHPDVLIDRWVRRYGTEGTETLCAWNNTVPDCVIHVNALRTDVIDLAERLRTASVDAHPHPAAPEQCLVISHGHRIADLPGYAQGLFTVCDPATTRAVALLDAQPGELVLDACAAPGGKTALIAQHMRNHGTLVAADLSERRLVRIGENAARLGLTCVMPVAADARDPEALETLTSHGLFDRILLDVPCTNTGVLRRRVDARWRFNADFLDGAVRMQQAILGAAAHVLASHGTMVYSTCSLEPEEGRLQIDAWLDAHKEFRLVRDESLFPPDSGTDGVYTARLERQ